MQFAIWYQAGSPFRTFLNKLGDKRQKAADTNDERLTRMIKLLGNSSFGKLGMRRDKYKQTYLEVSSKADRIAYKPFVEKSESISESSDLKQISKRYTSVTDNSPIQAFLCVLQEAKLKLIKVFKLIILLRF